MNLEEVWQKLIRQLKSYPSMSASQIDAFFSRMQIQAVSSDFIMFTASNSFIKDWIETHYLKSIAQALKDLYGVDYVIQIEVDPTSSSGVAAYTPEAPRGQATAEYAQGQTPQPFAADQQAEGFPGSGPSTNGFVQDREVLREVPNMETSPFRGQPYDQTSRSREFRKTPSEELSEYQRALVASQEQSVKRAIDPDQITSQRAKAEQRKNRQFSLAAPSLTFDNFVIGNSNRMAYSMAVEVADRPGDTSLNPLFIYGRSGVGKTHLLCAIQNYIHEQYPDQGVCYIDSMELVNRYSDAAIEKSVDKRSFKNFETYFEEADILLIDDIQGLQGKPGTLDAVFRIFNTMIAKGKQIVLSADRAPKNIDLDERYVSRFNSGATIDIQPPDDETKRNIIKNFLAQCCEEEGVSIDLDNEVIDYIVENSSSNVRELKSAITKVVFALRVSGEEPITRNKVKELLANHFISQTTNRLSIGSIQQAVEDFYGVSHADLIGKKRTKAIKHPRHVAIYLIRELQEETFKSIGEAFGRDHTTIMHSYDLIANSLKEDRNLREEIEAIREKLRIQEY